MIEKGFVVIEYGMNSDQKCCIVLGFWKCAFFRYVTVLKMSRGYLFPSSVEQLRHDIQACKTPTGVLGGKVVQEITRRTAHIDDLWVLDIAQKGLDRFIDKL